MLRPSESLEEKLQTDKGHHAEIVLLYLREKGQAEAGSGTSRRLSMSITLSMDALPGASHLFASISTCGASSASV